MTSSPHQWKKLKLSLPELIQHAALRWKRLIVTQESGSLLQHQYPLSAKFFLECAQEDFQERNSRGLVNALSNAKRAIDCQTDSHICAIRLNPNELPKQLGKSAVARLETSTREQKRPLKFRVLESLGIVTPAIVDRVRRIRHLLEHSYKKPTRAQVRDAIDIAALYVSALEGSMNSFLENVHLENGESPHPMGGDLTVPERSISLSLVDYRNPFHVEVSFRDFKGCQEADVHLLPSDPNYLPFMRLFYAARGRSHFEDALSSAVTGCGFPLPKTSIRIKEWSSGKRPLRAATKATWCLVRSAVTGRRWMRRRSRSANGIGIDITQLAISLIERRLKDRYGARCKFEVHGTPKGLDGVRNLAERDKYQFQ